MACNSEVGHLGLVSGGDLLFGWLQRETKGTKHFGGNRETDPYRHPEFS